MKKLLLFAGMLFAHTGLHARTAIVQEFINTKSFPRIAQILLDQPIYASLPLDDGTTPLHDVASHTPSFDRVFNPGDASRLAVLFLRADANPNAQDGRGDTPLHVVARSGDDGLCEVLRSAGASGQIRNHAGQLPSDIADARVRSSTPELVGIMSHFVSIARNLRISTPSPNLEAQG